MAQTFDVIEAAEARTDDVIRLRRDFHQHPELAFQETRTAQIVADRLREIGFDEVRTGIAKTGVVGVLQGRAPGKVVLWRADMDALPLTEDNASRPYASLTPGKMHACGHDGHVAIALAAAAIFAEHRESFDGTLMFLFQPAEEAVGGAAPMIAEGVMENPKVDKVLGIHMDSYGATGTISIRNGPSSASADFFEITVQGKGGHGSAPQDSIDPILPAAQIVIALQAIITREVDATKPAVLTICAIHAGTAPNIIPPSASLQGSLRTFDRDQRAHAVKRITEIAQSIAATFRATASVKFQDQTPTVINDPVVTEMVRTSAAKVIGANNVIEGDLIMGSDDMSCFMDVAPGTYIMVGAKPDGQVTPTPHHHPSFDLDERSLTVGVKVAVQSILDALEN